MRLTVIWFDSKEWKGHGKFYFICYDFSLFWLPGKVNRSRKHFFLKFSLWNFFFYYVSSILCLRTDYLVSIVQHWNVEPKRKRKITWKCLTLALLPFLESIKRFPAIQRNYDEKSHLLRFVLILGEKGHVSWKLRQYFMCRHRLGHRTYHSDRWKLISCCRAILILIIWST